MVLINNAFYTLPADRVDDGEKSLRELRDASRAEPGCLGFVISPSPNVFSLYETYRDEAALRTHFASEHFQRLVVDGLRKLATERVGYHCLEI